MLYTPLTQKAMKLAYAAHHGQTDQSGVPYIFHPFYVAESVCQAKREETFVCAAFLHDVLEDTHVTLEELEKEFPKEVTEAVLLLTHIPGENYFDYIERLKENPVARRVKMTDLRHNMDMSRLEGCANVTESQKSWRSRKYERAFAILEEEESMAGE